MRLPLSFLLSLLATAQAAVTVYNQTPLGLATATANAASYTGAAAYNPTVLNPPPIPQPPATTFTVQLQNGGVPGLSIPQHGSFFGFSIEMSVTNQVLGKNSTFIQVPFLNLMANLQARGGSVHVRVGGNTQETATLVPSLSDGRSLEKDLGGVSNPTQTPPLLITYDLLYMMGNISQLTNVYWYLGLPWNDTTNWRLDIAVEGQKILGDRLIGLQAGNEPDLYFRHGHRPAGYAPADYMNEIDSCLAAMAAGDPINSINKNLLIGPNIATGDWTSDMIIQAGFVPRFQANMVAFAVEHYPTDNCFAQFGVGIDHPPQDVFPTYLNHSAATGLVGPYATFANVATAASKPFLMFETNTASCGGFAGVSDSFGAALWGIDYALQMAYSNFSGAMFHIGGQNVFYNPFTSPPTNQSSFNQWTIGPLYYSAIVMAEAIGQSNQSQVIDLNANGGNQFTPAYAIYENGVPTKVALINFVTDASGASDLSVTVQVGGGQPQPTVQVKYLLAPSVSSKGNFTWAGQTFGDHFASDGRFMGQEDVKTVNCNSATFSCVISVPAPGVALVFLTSSALTAVESPPKTYPTTMLGRGKNTATVDKAVLATSNGHVGMGVGLGSTSKSDKTSGAGKERVLPGVMALMGMLAGMGVVRRALFR